MLYQLVGLYNSATLKYPPGHVATGYSLPQSFTDSDMDCRNHIDSQWQSQCHDRVHYEYSDIHACMFKHVHSRQSLLYLLNGLGY